MSEQTEFKNLDVYKKLIFLFKDISNIRRKIYEELRSNIHLDVSDFDGFHPQYDHEISILASQIPPLLDELYKYSHDNNLYYFDCPGSIYINHFELRKKDYQDEVLEANELDFLLSEIKYFSKPSSNRLLQNAYNYNDYLEYKDKYKISMRRKLEFLKPKLLKHGFAIKISENEQVLDPIFNGGDISTMITLEKVDFENNTAGINDIDTKKADNDDLALLLKSQKQLTVNQIVLLLQEVGFFTHPKIEKAPKTKQADLISKICGLNAKNIKTKIQNLDKSPKEVGLNNQKDIDKIEFILNNLE
jgi:hypothetical protein